MTTPKPRYSVPSMEEIRTLTPNGYTVASTFAGGGGSSTGYRMAGFRVGYANEFIPAAADTYRANCAPYTVVSETDIRETTPEQILDTLNLGPGELDVLDGSPPCASFSTAGARSRKWGQVSAYSDTTQRTDDLFYEYARLLTGIQPKVFVAENVTGLTKGVAVGYFKAIHKALAVAGYHVEARTLDASWLGVPQARRRVIFIGTRADLSCRPVFPSPHPFQYTLRDVLPWLTGQASGGLGEVGIRASDRPSGTLGASPQTGNGLSPPGIVVDGAVIHDTGGVMSHGDTFDRPCFTVTTSSESQFRVADPLNVTSPAEWRDGDAFDPETGQKITMHRGPLRDAYPDLPLRKFTLTELRSVCGFPPDYVLTGSYAQRWERLGRSVPPLMMKAIAETIRDKVLPCAG